MRIQKCAITKQSLKFLSSGLLHVTIRIKKNNRHEQAECNGYRMDDWSLIPVGHTLAHHYVKINSGKYPAF
jgi:hypothetical protein